MEQGHEIENFEIDSEEEDDIKVYGEDSQNYSMMDPNMREFLHGHHQECSFIDMNQDLILAEEGRLSPPIHETCHESPNVLQYREIQTRDMVRRDFTRLGSFNSTNESKQIERKNSKEATLNESRKSKSKKKTGSMTKNKGIKGGLLSDIISQMSSRRANEPNQHPSTGTDGLYRNEPLYNRGAQSSAQFEKKIDVASLQMRLQGRPEKPEMEVTTPRRTLIMPSRIQSMIENNLGTHKGLSNKLRQPAQTITNLKDSPDRQLHNIIQLLQPSSVVEEEPRIPSISEGIPDLAVNHEGTASQDIRLSPQKAKPVLPVKGINLIQVKGETGEDIFNKKGFDKSANSPRVFDKKKSATSTSKGRTKKERDGSKGDITKPKEVYQLNTLSHMLKKTNSLANL